MEKTIEMRGICVGRVGHVDKNGDLITKEVMEEMITEANKNGMVLPLVLGFNLDAKRNKRIGSVSDLRIDGDAVRGTVTVVNTEELDLGKMRIGSCMELVEVEEKKIRVIKDAKLISMGLFPGEHADGGVQTIEEQLAWKEKCCNTCRFAEMGSWEREELKGGNPCKDCDHQSGLYRNWKSKEEYKTDARK